MRYWYAMKQMNDHTQIRRFETKNERDLYVIDHKRDVEATDYVLAVEALGGTHKLVKKANRAGFDNLGIVRII